MSEEQEDYQICPYCMGSGEGLANSSRCSVCKGSGIVKSQVEIDAEEEAKDAYLQAKLDALRGK